MQRGWGWHHRSSPQQAHAVIAAVAPLLSRLDRMSTHLSRGRPLGRTYGPPAHGRVAAEATAEAAEGAAEALHPDHDRLARQHGEMAARARTSDRRLWYTPALTNHHNQQRRDAVSRSRPRTTPPPATPRGKSVIQHTGYDLKTALAVARQVRDSGLTPAPLRAVAAALAAGQSVATCEHKIYAAVRYGFVALRPGATGGASDLVVLPLLDALDDQPATTARACAFLNVALHRAIAERYRDQPLPDAAALRRVLAEELGVSAGQVGNVGRVVRRAAAQAGLFDREGRLTIPPDALVATDDPAGGTASAPGEVAPITPAAAFVAVPDPPPPPPREAAPVPVPEQVPPDIEAPLTTWLSEARRAWASWPGGKQRQWLATLSHMLDTYSLGE